MVRPGRTHGSGADTYDHRCLHLAVAHVAQFGRLQHDLPGGLEQEVSKHQVGHTAHTGCRCAQAGAGKAEFRDRRVYHAAGAEFLEQVLGVGKGAAPLPRALAKIQDQRITPHLLGQPVPHRVEPPRADRDGTRRHGGQRGRRVDRLGVNMPVYRGRVGLG